MVLRRGGLLLAVGALLGLVLATIAMSALPSLVYGIAPRDVPSFVLAALVLFVMSMAAFYGPAHRAAGLEPTVALRSE